MAPTNNTTITLQSIVSLASIHVELMPLSGVGGVTSEPALSLCNDTLQELIANPSAWKFNRAEMPIFITCPNKQDYQYGGASSFSTTQGWAIDLASNNALTESAGTVTVKTLEAHNYAIGDTVYLVGLVLASDGVTPSAYNAVFTQTSSSSGWTGGVVITGVATKSFTFAGSTSETSGAPGITDFGWLESGTMREINSAAPIPRTWQLNGVNDIHPSSLVTGPTKVCVLTDNGDGTLKIRFEYVPGTVIYSCALIYQRKAPLKTLLSQFWDPFPDQYSFVYRQMFLAHAYRYVDSPKADAEFQKAEMKIAKALGRDDAEESDQYLYPESSLIQNTWGYDSF